MVAASSPTIYRSDLFQKEYPFTSHYLDLGGLRYHYLDEGQGETLLMLHGNPSWSFYYRRLAADLRHDYRVIVPDHIGCGLSDKPADSQYSYRLEQRVDDLDRLMAHLKPQKKITLVVHDWGGMIGMTWALRHPQRIGRLIILNTAAFHLPPEKPLPLALKLCRETQLGAFLVQGCNLFARSAAWVGCKRKRLSAELRKIYCSPYDNWHNRIATLRFVQDIPLKPEDPGYTLISETAAGLSRFSKLPICICWGEQDFVFDDHFLQTWLATYPDAEVHRFADCGHYVLEDAGDEIVPLIRNFLQRNPLTQGFQEA
jgi:haloalkane dehalogenase